MVIRYRIVIGGHWGVGISLFSSDFDSVTANRLCGREKLESAAGGVLLIANEYIDLSSVGDVGLSGKGFAVAC